MLAEGRARGVPLRRVPWGRREAVSFIDEMDSSCDLVGIGGAKASEKLLGCIHHVVLTILVIAVLAR